MLLTDTMEIEFCNCCCPATKKHSYTVTIVFFRITLNNKCALLYLMLFIKWWLFLKFGDKSKTFILYLRYKKM